MEEQSRRTFLQNAGLASLASVSNITAEPERAKELFIHHVFFYLKEPSNAQHETQLLEGLHKLAKVPTIDYVHIGKPAPTSRSVIVNDYSISWMCLFKNIIEEEIYQTHPIHLDFIKNYGHLWEKVVVYDSVGPKKVG
ncbi:Dabb family protein [Dyadobacter sp. CY261]|uniref:Dabb family protein n=1 Tax=Dyadobacter sp. CY261 TaxID=2907203 RepID=UPI001F2E77C7|nr:Dabb family protein [Dyadobacter sp. CY261]MCF0070955.1 Dabb family protein [Dyadobacter sp. CY261]